MTESPPDLFAAEVPRAAAPPDAPAFVDAWPGDRPVPLDGWFERNRFQPVWAAVLVFVLAFLVFNVVGGVVIAVGPVMETLKGGGAPPEVNDLLTKYPYLFLGGNAVGQVVAFGLLAWLAARLSTRRTAAFLRLRAPGAEGLGLAALGWAALYPGVLLLGELNAKLPVPQWIESMDQMRADALEALLLGSDVSTLFLFLTVALTPALFEELLFRGYLQRQVERRFGAMTSLVAVGIFFGLYHMSVTQLVPLSVLGIYLGFVVWATGSLWTGVLVHLLNNGTAVVIAGFARGNPAMDIESMEGMGVPTYLSAGAALVGALGVWAVCRALAARRAAHTDGQPDTRPVASLSPLSPVAPPVL